MNNVLTQKEKSTLLHNKTFYVIGIGSSAGGLKALKEFFDYCPSDTGFAFVIIQHLSPDYKSLMPELLARHTEMSVQEAKQGDIIAPNHVYLIPGERNIQLHKGALELTKRPPSDQMNFSIDLFLNSLASSQKEKAIAIILSGTGSDGTKGAKAIKEIGGTIFVQSPESCDFDGMPKSVISQGLADYILSPKDMGKELIDFISNPNYIYTHPLANTQNTDESLGRILRIIKRHVGYDFSYYKKPTLLRRTAKRIHITKCKTTDNYIDYLYEYPNEKFLLTQEYLISVTKFFRDKKAFEILEKQVIPKLVATKQKGEIIKIWVIACSTGEEAYSITILLEEYLQKKQLDIDYKVFATDIDNSVIDVATKGIYNENIISEVPANLLKKYFLKKKDKYQIVPNIRKKIIFSKHDVLQNPPFNKIDLVSCRNMLIYMENTIQLKVLSSIHYALNLHGYLFLGSSENLGALHKNFKEINTKWKVYKNIQSERILNINKGNIWKVDKDENTKFHFTKQASTLDDKITKSINKLLMEEMQVVSICIDDNYEIIHASGKLKKYIQYPEEGFSNNLLKIVPDALSIPIATSVRKLCVSSTKTVEKQIKLLIDDQLKQLRVLINRFTIPTVNSHSFLITIIEEFDRKITEADKIQITPTLVSNEEQVQELKEALNETRENLQSTIEELETSNEEMQATNEELLAANEELQSTNEELQSLNEELHAVNTELHEKNKQLIELNSDIQNLMKNINVGAIFLDKSFLIRKYTPAINDHFQLQPEDIGRSITHFSGTMVGEDLITHAKKVIKTLQPYRKEVKNAEGRWFIMQIFPYRSQEDSIQGVVINFVDINDLKFAIQEKEKLNSFLSHLMDSNPAIIYVYDIVKQHNVYSSANIAEVAGYTPLEIQQMGNKVLQKIIHSGDMQKIYEHHTQILRSKTDDVKQIEYRIVHKDTNDIIWLLSSDKVNERNKDGSVKTILGVTQIITHSKQMEIKLKESEERFRLAINATRSGLWEWSDLQKDQAWYSPEFYELTGTTEQEMNGTFSELVNLIHPDQIKVFRTGLEEYVQTGNIFEEEIQIKTKKNGYRWFRINGQMQQAMNSKAVKKIVGTLLDINNRKESERKMQELNIELERFAYLASHDLKEPLRTVTSFTKLFKEEYSDQFDENASKYLSFIENASARMITLTNDLLVYSQLDDKSLNFQNVNLNALINNITEDLFNTILENNAKIRVDKLPNITCDSLQIKQLFQNLIANSLKYRSEKDPIIHIGCIKKQSHFIFYLKDNGIGIAPKYHTQIFEVFKRLHTQSEYEGTGIGLANCKRIIDNHQGKIWVESKEAEGAKFLFTIPKIKVK